MYKMNRLDLPCSLELLGDMVVDAHDLEVIPVSPDIAQVAILLPDIVNYDPADRIISATAIVYETSVLTPDTNLLANDDVPTIW